MVWYDMCQTGIHAKSCKIWNKMESKCNLCICLGWQGTNSDIWKRFMFPSGDICNESEACGVS